MDKRNQENDFGLPKMPRSLNVLRFAEARAQEVKKMICDLTDTNGTKLIFQTLPKHMRRRTMSHYIKRLPHKHREGHLNQLKKSGMPNKNKRPSRKFRRKPSNLLSEYSRRARRISWLETHIWHAKRFHMGEKWGYKLPLRSCDKNFRSCYRASAKYCLLQDVSYLTHIEICGDQKLILEGLKSVTNQCSGLTFGAKAYLSGGREGETIFYRKNLYPFGAIGKVNFIWKPDRNTLWIWCHPLVSTEIVENLQEIFKLTEISLQKYASDKITLKILKNFFNRFRLTGPLSNAIISNVFKPPSPQNSTKWFDTYLNCPENRQIYSDQSHFLSELENLPSPTDISPRLVINCISVDPRYNFPLKRTKSTFDSEKCSDFSPCDNLRFGKIWELTKENFVEKSKMSTAQFLKDRASMIVPETFPDTVSVLPIMLIQRPGCSESTSLLGYGAGWDILIPPGWAIPVWLCLIMWGAKAGGLRETESIQYEMARYDILPPDTKAGQIEILGLDKSYRTKYFKLPPAKRVNYNKFGVASPFRCDWEKLIADWNDSDVLASDFYVLRERLILGQIQEIVSKSKLDMSKKLDQFDSLVSKLNKNCLVPVKLSLLAKGKASRYSIICLPKEIDFKNKDGPTEPKRNDPNQKERNRLHKEHKIFLKRMSRKRCRAKKIGRQVSHPLDEINKFHEKMQNLWLPQSENIKDSCSRKVIGFVTKGDVSFVTGCGQSIGFVPITAFRSLLTHSKTDRVLVRSTNSRQYRFAKMDIICTNS